MNLDLQITSTAQELAHKAASYLVTKTKEAVALRGCAYIAISGGSTPKATLSLLADVTQPYHKEMPWDSLYLYFVDERCVPPTDEESNYKMVKENLLDFVALDPSHVFRMKGELDPLEAANQYEQTLPPYKNNDSRFDVVLLGMGDDGHTASLFPFSQGLREQQKCVIANFVEKFGKWRITLTKQVINKSRNVCFLISGVSKAVVVAEVFEGPRDEERLPSQLIQPQSGTLTLMLDQDAAMQLRSA